MTNIIGKPNFIQPAKSRPNALAAIALGGEPTKLPRPPMLAEYATPKRTNTKVLRSLSRSKCDNMPNTKGSIMAAVAVLLIHMDKNAVTPNTTKDATPKCPFEIEMSHKAIFRSSCWTCKAVAKAKPPKNKKIIGSANELNALCVVISGIPIATASTGIIRAVMVM